MSKDTSAPAFPSTLDNTSHKDVIGFIGDIIKPGTHTGYKGLSIREYAAIKAMQGLLANSSALDYLGAYALQQKKPLPEIVANSAANYADALLAKLEK